MSQLMIWLIGVVGILLMACLILWLATKVQRERVGKERKPGIRVNSFFSGPVGTGIYKPVDDRRKASEKTDDDEPSE